MTRLLLLALPGGALLYAASFLLRCRHQHEIFDRVDGLSVLRCADCLRVRPNPLAEAERAYRRTQESRNYPGIPDSLTGIEREAARAAQERGAVEGTIAALEKPRRYAEIGARVRRRGFEVVERNGGAA